MTTGALVEQALRRDRLVVVFCLLLAIVLSWSYLLSGAGMMQEMGDMVMPMSAGPWTPAHAALVFVMWAVMMAAMMLPSAAPMILLYATIVRRRSEQGHQPASASGAFALGYLAVWLAFSLAATALQYGLERAALLSPMMQSSSRVLAGAVLILTGLYQWTPLKRACLRHCRSPLDFIMTGWRPGTGGAFRMGSAHGAFCLGCCWSLMLLLFVGGVMNFGWIAGIALFILIEKLSPAGHWIGRGAGVLLVAWGAAVLLASSEPGVVLDVFSTIVGH